MSENVILSQLTSSGYQELYPKTLAKQIDDVYNKSEIGNLFLPKAGGSMGGILDMNGNRITNLPTPTSNSEPATKGYVDGAIGEKVYDYLSEFNIPKTINCYLANDNTSTRYGTATITNYIGYSIVSTNITNADYSIHKLFKSNDSEVLAGYEVYGIQKINIRSNNGAQKPQINGGWIWIYADVNSKYLFPFNLI